MRRRLTSLFVIVLALAFGSQAPSSQTALEIPQAVTDRIAADGSALVIVGVRASFIPEGQLASPDEIQAQRDAMHAVVDGAMTDAAAAGVVVGQRFETIPFYTARVDASSLPALASLPTTASIAQNSLDSLNLATSVPLINAPAAWAAGATGAGWTVAVLDTGVEKTHSFLAGKVLSEACYSNAGGLGTGLSTCPGGATASVAVGSGVACNAAVSGCDHGTHVAGIAAGANGPSGANGVAPGAGLLAMQVFTYFSGTGCGSGPSPCAQSYVSDQVLALERVMALAGPGNANRVAAVNMSLGGGQFFSQATCDSQNISNGRKPAIDNLRSVGIAAVIASGNNGFPTSMGEPGCISTAVSVGSTSKTDAVSPFSNRASFLSLMAPGGDGTLAGAIVSSVIGNTFGAKQGTSMATPHVAGAWAILKQAAPTASVDQILTAFQATGTAIPDGALTHRRINVNAARLALVGGGSLPGAPTAPTIGGSGNNVVISWGPPISGGAPTSYTVLARLTPGGPIVASLPAGAAFSAPVAAPNGTFTVSVRASNGAGHGPESPGTTFSVPIVGPPPGPPTGLGVVVNVNAAQFTWTPPASGGPPSLYVLRASLSPSGPPITSLNIPASQTSALITGIPAGTYFVRLAAVNAGGASAFSNEVMVSVVPPGAPALNPASLSGRSVTLSWTPGGGGAATSFRVVASLTPGSAPVASVPAGGTSVIVPAPPGTFFVRVHGVNAVGTGAASNEIMVVVP